MIQALEAEQLSKRYRRVFALRDCNLSIPIGRIVGLVGPNGAGKSTLLHIAVGLLRPSGGAIKVLGLVPSQQRTQLLPRIGFVAQERSLYKTFTVKDMLTVGRKLNAHWDQELALNRLARLDIPLERQIGKLSGGQQAQISLLMALAKRPELLILDEPVASLDPLARREFQQSLMDAVAESGLTVILSSHIVADLERLCDYLVILSGSRVQVTSDTDALLASHKLLVGPKERVESVGRTHTILSETTAGRQSTLLVQTQGPVLDPAWEVREVSLEDIILAYLAQKPETEQKKEDAKKLEVLP